MNRVVHFEIHAEDPQRAIAFYEGLFGWTFTQWGGMDYWLITTGTEPPGIDGGLMPRRGPIDGTAVFAFVCTVNVEQVDESLAAAVRLGGTVAAPKMPIPGVGWLVYANDTEGNIFGMMHNDPAAA